ncbi:MAG: hypothetical protein AAGK04_02650 [Planctomycetota bacterium]
MIFRMLCIALACVASRAAASTLVDPHEITLDHLLAEANTAMQAAAEAEPAEQAPHLRRALAAYETIHREHDRSSAPLHLSAGNAALLLGEAGPAVLHYRKALRHDPTNNAARQGLGAARSLVQTPAAPSATDRVARLALAWRGLVAPRNIFIATLAAIALLCLAWSARLLTGRRVPRWPFAFAACVGAATILTDAAAQARPEGVVIGESTVARTGPGEALYPPAFTEPLAPGVEFRVIERRDDWIQAAFGAAGNAWIRASDAESI